jgi:hypothetical protein
LTTPPKAQARQRGPMKNLVKVETVNPIFGAITNRQCEILKKYFYKSEEWYKLRDTSTGTVFDSPEIFWVSIKVS